MLNSELWYRVAVYIDVDKVVKALGVLGFRYVSTTEHDNYESASGQKVQVQRKNMSPGVLQNIAEKLGLTASQLWEFSNDPEAQKKYERGELVIRDRKFLPPLGPPASTRHIPDPKLTQILQNEARGVLEGGPLIYALNAFLAQFGDPSKKEERQTTLQRIALDPESQQLVEMVLEEAKNKIAYRSASIVSEKWMSGQPLAAFGAVKAPEKKSSQTY